MSTRTVASRLEALIEKVAELEELGRKLQLDDELSAPEAAARLDDAYRTWYSSALTLLPDDLKERFRFEYEGDWIRFRVKHFLQEPRQRSTFYDSLDEEAKKTLNPSPWQYPFSDVFRGPLTSQKQLLMEAVARYGISTDTLDGLSALEQISRRLPASFAVLRREIQKRPGISVKDEYDLQRILHAFAVLIFEEVESEDPTPKMAGASSRLDFLLRRERIAVETKMMGEYLGVRKLRSDLADDILYFRAHPDASALFILIYDPDRKITNPAGFERDLHSDSDEFPIRVVIAS